MEMRAACLGLIVWLACASCSRVMAAPPSILLIVSDDQRPDTIHALGNETISTPNLDRPRARGRCRRR